MGLHPEAATVEDTTGFLIKHWAIEHCMDDEAKIPLVDFSRFDTCVNGHKISIRDGIQTDGIYIGYGSCLDNAEGTINL